MSQHTAFDLGMIGYTAYGLRTGGRTHDGRPMPAWENLGPTQNAWAAAAAAIANAAAAASRRAPGA